MRLLYILLTLILLISYIKCNFLENARRAKLFKLTDFKIPKIYLNMTEKVFEKLKNSAFYEDNKYIKGVQMDFVIDGKKTYSYSSIKIKIGGQHTKTVRKPGYNIIIQDKNESLLGRKHIRLRSDMRDASMIRSKLTCDLLNHLRLPSISANYCHLYIRGEFMGLYIIQDIYKPSWIKSYYKNVIPNKLVLYHCKGIGSDMTRNNINTCINLSAKSSFNPLKKFLKSIENANTRADVESFMDVDEFIKVWIIEWLIGSWDHMLQSGKNYYLYLQNNGKWQILIYDFDSTFGQFLPKDYVLPEDDGVLKKEKISKNIKNNIKDNEFNNTDENINKWQYEKKELSPVVIGPYMNELSSSYDFTDWYVNRTIVDILVKNDEESFLKNLVEIIENGFNPKFLFPRIDEIREWLDPYIKEDRTEVNGQLPGRINVHGKGLDFTYEDFKESDYTTINSGVGIKKWIQDRYDFVCQHYNITKTNYSNNKKND
ncbi:hypothetical protein BCR36DRAFT_402536 [Piromyces finnis]|uniref:Coth-domain-containing protein n=1 Tax=Piromyces finnis TaxID=1754191 RepID=A0A1Y1VHM5_9FUNG|nr:hypothetical protein BCR36DRAFT_402536 [Piromyces finnis]|eukprot:ORX56523.1 hypothetical protein BCR36DRAFT_402536 [Piromyces finnis]